MPSAKRDGSARSPAAQFMASIYIQNALKLASPFSRLYSGGHKAVIFMSTRCLSRVAKTPVNDNRLVYETLKQSARYVAASKICAGISTYY